MGNLIRLRNKKNTFYRYITFFGIMGTLITFFIISFFAVIFNKFDFILEKKLEFFEILLLASILTSTDTVAALSLIKES